MGKNYVEMSDSEISNRIKIFHKYYPGFCRKFEVVKKIMKKDGAPLRNLGLFFHCFERLAIEYSTKCPEIMVMTVGMEVVSVSN